MVFFRRDVSKGDEFVATECMDMSSEGFWFGCKLFGCEVFSVRFCIIKDGEGISTFIETRYDGDAVCTMRDWSWLQIVSFVFGEGWWIGELYVKLVMVLAI